MLRVAKTIDSLRIDSLRTCEPIKDVLQPKFSVSVHEERDRRYFAERCAALLKSDGRSFLEA